LKTLTWGSNKEELTQKVTVRCVYFNPVKTALRQKMGTICKLSDDMINVRMGHSFWNPKNDIPDDSRSQTVSDMKGHFTRPNGSLEKAPFPCTSRGLATGMTYLSDCGRSVLLAGNCVLFPTFHGLVVISPIFPCGQVTIAP
jgi:hypothetical protein